MNGDMSSSMNTIVRTPTSAREQIKQAALRLFAQRGVDGVTVRAIVAASGQKNHGSISYYFGTKEALIRELVADGARVIEQRRSACLDRIESRDGPISIREIVEALVYPSFDIMRELGGQEDNYIRFITLLSLTHRDLFIEALEDRLNSAYLRCLDHLRTLMPDLPYHAKNRRLVFMEAYLNSVISLRERGLCNPNRQSKMWTSDEAIRDLVETIVALLQAPGPEDNPLPSRQIMQSAHPVPPPPDRR